MTDRELFEQALKALETNNRAWKNLADSGDAGFWEAEEQPFYETSVKAITALRSALAQQAEPVEPVACEWPSCGCRVDLGEDWKACSPEAALSQNPSTV